MFGRRSAGRVQHRADRHYTGVEITPQRHHELARHRDDGDPPDAPLDVAHPLAEPAAEFAVGLMTEPQPGDLDRRLASAAVAGFADALFAHAVAAVVGRSGQPDIAADLAAVVEVAIEYFVDQSLPADRADTLEGCQLHDLGLRRAGLRGAPFGFAVG